MLDAVRRFAKRPVVTRFCVTAVSISVLDSDIDMIYNKYYLKGTDILIYIIFTKN